MRVNNFQKEKAITKAFISFGILVLINASPVWSYYSPKWVEYRIGFFIPDNAMVAGHDSSGHPIFVGRANYHGHILPAKVIPSKSKIYISIFGTEISVDICQVLVHLGFNWVTARDGYVPPNAVATGRNSVGELYFVGRVHYCYATTVGKILPSHGCIYVPYDGQERSFREYEVLVYGGCGPCGPCPRPCSVEANKAG